MNDNIHLEILREIKAIRKILSPMEREQERRKPKWREEMPGKWVCADQSGLTYAVCYSKSKP